MESVEQAEKCIQHLNKTELHGRTIYVEKNRPGESSGSSKSKSSSKKGKDKDKEDQDDSSSKEDDKKDDTSDDKKEEKPKSDTDEKDKKDDADNKKSKSKERRSKERSKSNERRKSPFRSLAQRRPIPPRRMPLRRPAPSFITMRRVLMNRGMGPGIRPNPVLLRRIETERVIRRRERERELRETERKRMEFIRHQREIERKHHEESVRLEREKEKLRLERERLEREKAELIRLERDKARLERERIEREREEIRRRQAQIPHRLDEGARGRPSSTVTAKRPYDSREVESYWEDRKRVAARLDAPPPPAPGRPSFADPSGSRFSDFDARNSHGTPYDSRGDGYKRNKLDIPSTGPSRQEYELRRDSARHGGHDRDDRRGSGGGQSGYYRESSRGGPPQSRDRERRGGGGGGREDWKMSHDRRDRYLDKSLSAGATAYGTNARSYASGDRLEWTTNDRSAQSSIGKLSYANSTSVSDSRSRGQPGINPSMLTGNTPMGSIFGGSSNVTMGSILSHANLGAGPGGVNSGGERSYMHSVRRF